MKTLCFDALAEARFAAANSYGGFISDFDEIFNPRCFERIFILKGGPGTGKSTLLKELYERFSKKVHCEAIYCSSDPFSLDGIILGSNKKIALIDGTSPHLTDPYLPGAVELIVNLGEGFDLVKLREAASDISNISKRKSEAYSKAYSYLRLAGEIDKEIKRIYLNSANYFEAENMIDKLSDLSECSFLGKKRISAFCKFGHIRLPNKTENKVAISGDGYSEILFMMLLKRSLTEGGRLKYSCPSPLNPSYTDALYTASGIIYLSNEESDLDTRAIAPSNDEAAASLLDMHNRVLDLAKGALIKASEEHFALEEIYTSAMNFEHNDKIREALSNECQQLLFS